MDKGTRAERFRAVTDRGLSVAIPGVMASEVLWLATGVVPFAVGAELGVIAVTALTVSRFGLREVYLITLCAALTVAALQLSPDPAAAIWGALDQAAFLMAFILLIGLIQQAASTSEAMRACGLYLTRQPAGRRFFALFLGTHFMAQLYNLGVVSLLAPLIMRGSEANAADTLQPIREQRQLNAMLRGFAWCVIWSPTAVAPLVLATLLPDAERGPWIAAGLVLAFVAMMIGWAEDRWQWRRVRRSLVSGAPRVAPPFPRSAYAQFGMVCVALLALTVAGMLIFGGSVVFGLMLASPIILVGWVTAQNGGNWHETARRVETIRRDTLPGAAPLAVTLACSGFIGRAAAGLIPAEEWAAATGLATMPGWLFCTGLAVAVAALSQFALSPIMMAVFFGALIADLPVLPVHATWAALAISCGWALSMTISPFATVVLMIEGVTGHRGREMTWEWNWRYSLLCTIALAVAFWLLTGGR
ncbi:MAG: hypothetical protein AAFX62_06755 [Pseudomonadota bacterium]